MVLAKLDTARFALAEAKTVEEVLELRDQAAAMQVYTRQRDYSLECQNDAIEIKLRAERKLGELLKETVEHSGGSKAVMSSSLLPENVSRTQSSRWQQAAELQEEDFEQHIVDVRAQGETLTSEGVRKKSREIKRKENEVARQEKVDAWDQLRIETVSLPKYTPILYVAKAEELPLDDKSIELIITSPPYNLGHADWPMGGGEGRQGGIGYPDSMPEYDYQEWQLSVFEELYRVAKPGASFFYNHKVRQIDGTLIHPIEWIMRDNPWTLRQEIVWDRESTHNHTPTLFWQEDERIYWMTKGKPFLPEGSIHESTVWTFAGPTSGQWHPAPFTKELPSMLIRAIAVDGSLILDPFGGSMVTCVVAQELGFDSIGVDINEEYIKQARSEYGW